MTHSKNKLNLVLSNLPFISALLIVFIATIFTWHHYSYAQNPTTLRADFTGDGIVNAQDLDILKSNWNSDLRTYDDDGRKLRGDANKDGTVDIKDLAILSVEWGRQIGQPPSPPPPSSVDVTPPSKTVKLIFIHHSTGENWLRDNHGQLGLALRNNNYFVSDTNYGWGRNLPYSRNDTIGSTTDIGDWWTWFRGPNAEQYMAALYAESDKHSTADGGYSRLATDPGGPNEIIMFKSCFPNSVLRDDGTSIPSIGSNLLKGKAWGGGPGWEVYTVSNAKGIYIDLLEYFRRHPEKLFVAVVAPPVVTENTPDGRKLANWLVYHWLQDSNYTVGNVMVFDLYNVLTSKTGTGENDAGLSIGNHHRVWNGAIQHKNNEGVDKLAYPTNGSDSHPNPAGGKKATAEFVPMLNAAYNAWKKK